MAAVHAHLGLGKVAMERNDIESAAEHFARASAAADASRYRFGRAQTLVHWAYMTLWHHSAELALDQFQEAASIAGALDDPVFQGNAQLGAAECAERLGQLDRMERHGKDAYATFVSVHSAHGQGNAAQRLAGWLHRRGRHAEAWEWLDLALAAFRQDGNPTGLANLHSLRGDLLLDERRFAEAGDEHGRALELATSAGLSRARAHAVHDLGRTARGLGDWPGAVALFTRSLREYRDLGDLLGMSNAFGKLAEAQEKCGSADEALRTWREAVVEVEHYRADHQEDRFQEEYRRRFRGIYGGALSAAEQHRSPRPSPWWPTSWPAAGWRDCWRRAVPRRPARHRTGCGNCSPERTADCWPTGAPQGRTPTARAVRAASAGWARSTPGRTPGPRRTSPSTTCSPRCTSPADEGGALLGRCPTDATPSSSSSTRWRRSWCAGCGSPGRQGRPGQLPADAARPGPAVRPAVR
ncbi:tetratricopeptide repeat protein [Streptomyces zhihengii]